MFFSTIFLILMYIILKYVLAWISYVNSQDSRLGESTWRWTYDYQVIGERDYSDLDDKDFVRLRRKKQISNNYVFSFSYNVCIIYVLVK